MNLVTDAVQRGRELVQSARSVAELRMVEPEAFGKRSALAKLTGTLRDLSPDQRAELGRALQAAT